MGAGYGSGVPLGGPGWGFLLFVVEAEIVQHVVEPGGDVVIDLDHFGNLLRRGCRGFFLGFGFDLHLGFRRDFGFIDHCGQLGGLLGCRGGGVIFGDRGRLGCGFRSLGFTVVDFSRARRTADDVLHTSVSSTSFTSTAIASSMNPIGLKVRAGCATV